MRSPLKVIVGNSGWMMTDRLVRMLLGVTVGAWIARHLGPDRYGALAYATAFMALFQTASSLGLDMILARELAKDTTQAHRILGTSACLRVAAGVFGWLVACVSMAVIRPSDSEALLLTALIGATLLLQPADLIDLWFQSQSQSRRAVVPRILSFLLVSSLRVGLILSEAPLWAFAATYIAESMLALAMLLISYRYFATPRAWNWHAPSVKPLLDHAWPLLVSSLSIIVYMRIDQILLRSLSGERELGLYSAILPFSQAWHFVPVAICTSATPILVRLYGNSKLEFEKRISNIFGILTWCSLSVCGLILMSSGLIVRTFLGENYDGAEKILNIHIFSNVAVFLGVAQSRYLSIVGKTRIILIQTTIGMIASVLLNVALIPIYGARGAAISSVAAFSISAVLCNLYLSRQLFILQISSWIHPHAK